MAVDVSRQFSSQRSVWLDVLDHALLDEDELGTALAYILPLMRGEQEYCSTATGSNNWLGMIPVPSAYRQVGQNSRLTVKKGNRKTEDEGPAASAIYRMDRCQHIYLAMAGSHIINEYILSGAADAELGLEASARSSALVTAKKRREVTFRQLKLLVDAVKWRSTLFSQSDPNGSAPRVSNPEIKESTVSHIISFGSPDITLQGCPCIHVGAPPITRWKNGDGQMFFKAGLFPEISWCVKQSLLDKQARFWVCVMALVSFSGGCYSDYRNSDETKDYVRYLRDVRSALVSGSDAPTWSPFPPPPGDVRYPRGRRPDDFVVITPDKLGSLYTWAEKPAFKNKATAKELEALANVFEKERRIVPFVQREDGISMNPCIRHNMVPQYVYWAIGACHYLNSYASSLSHLPAGSLYPDVHLMFQDLFRVGYYDGCNRLKKVKSTMDEAMKLLPCITVVPTHFEASAPPDRAEASVTYWAGELRISTCNYVGGVDYVSQPAHYYRTGYKDGFVDLRDAIMSDLHEFGMTEFRQFFETALMGGRSLHVAVKAALYEPLCAFGYSYSDHSQAILTSPDPDFDYPTTDDPVLSVYAREAERDLAERLRIISECATTQSRITTFEESVEYLLKNMTTDKRSGYKVTIDVDDDAYVALGHDRRSKVPRGKKKIDKSTFSSTSKALTQAFMLLFIASADAMFRAPDWVSFADIGARFVAGFRLARAMYMVYTANQVGLSVVYFAIMEALNRDQHLKESVIPYRSMETVSARTLFTMLGSVYAMVKVGAPAEDEPAFYVINTDYTSMDQHLGYVVDRTIDHLRDATGGPVFSIPRVSPKGEIASTISMRISDVAADSLRACTMGVYGKPDSNYLKQPATVILNAKMGVGVLISGTEVRMPARWNTSGNLVTTPMNCLTTATNLDVTCQVFGDDSVAVVPRSYLSPGKNPIPKIVGRGIGLRQKVDPMDCNIGPSGNFLKTKAEGLQMYQRVKALSSERNERASPLDVSALLVSEYEAVIRSGSISGCLSRYKHVVDSCSAFKSFGTPKQLDSYNWLIGGGSFPKLSGLVPISSHKMVYEHFPALVRAAMDRMGFKLNTSKGTDVVDLTTMVDVAETVANGMMSIWSDSAKVGFTVRGRIMSKVDDVDRKKFDTVMIEDPVATCKKNMQWSSNPEKVMFSEAVLRDIRAEGVRRRDGTMDTTPFLRRQAESVAYGNRISVKAAGVLKDVISENASKKRLYKNIRAHMDAGGVREAGRIGMIDQTRRLRFSVARGNYSININLAFVGSFEFTYREHGVCDCEFDWDSMFGAFPGSSTQFKFHRVGLLSRGPLEDAMLACYGLDISYSLATPKPRGLPVSIIRGRPEITLSQIKSLYPLTPDQIATLCGGEFLPMYREVSQLDRLMCFHDLEDMGSARMSGPLGDVGYEGLDKLHLVDISQMDVLSEAELSCLKEHYLAYVLTLWNAHITATLPPVVSTYTFSLPLVRMHYSISSPVGGR